MRKFRRIFLLSLFILFSFGFVRKNHNVSFDYHINHYDKKSKIFDVTFSIHNNSADTIYFLSESCADANSLIVYDNSKFEIFSPLCNSSFPMIDKISPNDSFDFTTTFKKLKRNKKVKFGIYLYSVPKSFDVNKMDMNDFSELIIAKKDEIYFEGADIEIK